MKIIDAEDAYRKSQEFLVSGNPADAARALFTGAHLYVSDPAQHEQAKRLVSDGIALSDKIPVDQLSTGWITLASMEAAHARPLRERLQFLELREFVLEQAVAFSRKFPSKLDEFNMLEWLAKTYWWNAEFFWLAKQHESGEQRKIKALEIIAELTPDQASELQKTLCHGYHSKSEKMPTAALKDLSDSYRKQVCVFSDAEMHEWTRARSQRREAFLEEAATIRKSREELAKLVSNHLTESWKTYSNVYGEVGVGFNDGVVQSILFHFATASNKCGEYKRYEGPLPAAITADDRRSDVWTKLGMRPARTEEVPGPDRRDIYNWDYFYIDNVQLTFDFNSVTNMMVGLSIQLETPQPDPVYES